MARSNDGNLVALTAASSPVASLGAVTLACMFKPAALNQNYNLIFLSDAGFSNYIGIIYDGPNSNGQGSNVVLADSIPAGEVFGVSPTGGSTSVWNHAAGVFASTTSRKAYLNGAGGTVNTTSKNPVGMNNTWVCGFNTFSPLNGSMAEVGIWNVALTDAEILSLSKGISPLLVRTNNLVRYWPLLGVGTETCRISGTTLTNTGALPKAPHSTVFMPRPMTIGKGTVGGTNNPKTVNVTGTTTSTVSKQTGKVTSATGTSTSTMLKQARKIVSATGTTTSIVAKQARKIIAATSTTTSTVIKQAGKIISATATSTSTVIALKAFLKVINATATTTSSMLRSVGKIVNATATSTSTVIKQARRTISATATSTSAIAAQKIKVAIINATATTTSAVVKQARKIVNATNNTTSTVLKNARKIINATGTTTTTLAVGKFFVRVINATATTTSNIIKRAGKIVDAVGTTVSAVIATLVLPGVFPVVVNATSTTTSTIRKQAGKVVDAIAGTNSTMFKRISKVIQAIASTIGSIFVTAFVQMLSPSRRVIHADPSPETRVLHGPEQEIRVIKTRVDDDTITVVA